MDNWYVNDYIVTSNFAIHAKVHDESSGIIILFVDNVQWNNIYEKFGCSKKKNKLILEAESNLN